MAQRYDTQLLVQLAGEAIVYSFAGFEFAAGEFPQASLVGIVGALREQYPAGTVDQCRGRDMDQVPIAGSGRRSWRICHCGLQPLGGRLMAYRLAADP